MGDMADDAFDQILDYQDHCDRILYEQQTIPTIRLCCWCDSPADGQPVTYAGAEHPACVRHSEQYRAPPETDDGAHYQASYAYAAGYPN